MKTESTSVIQHAYTKPLHLYLLSGVFWMTTTRMTALYQHLDSSSSSMDQLQINVWFLLRITSSSWRPLRPSLVVCSGSFKSTHPGRTETHLGRDLFHPIRNIIMWWFKIPTRYTFYEPTQTVSAHEEPASCTFLSWMSWEPYLQFHIPSRPLVSTKPGFSLKPSACPSFTFMGDIPSRLNFLDFLALRSGCIDSISSDSENSIISSCELCPWWVEAYEVLNLDNLNSVVSEGRCSEVVGFFLSFCKFFTDSSIELKLFLRLEASLGSSLGVKRGEEYLVSIPGIWIIRSTSDGGSWEWWLLSGGSLLTINGIASGRVSIDAAARMSENVSEFSLGDDPERFAVSSSSTFLPSLQVQCM